MTNQGYENKKRLKRYQEDTAKELVFKAVRGVGTCSTKEIKQYLDNCSREKAEDMYSQDIIDKSEISKISKINTIARETIQRKLKELMNEGSIKKDSNNKYSLSEMALSDLRYFNYEYGRKFGDDLFSNLLGFYYPSKQNIKSNLKEFISILGFYLLYSLIESCRPINIQNKDKYIENKNKDTITQKWFEQSINHKTLLDSFISIISNQYIDERKKDFVTRYSKKNYEKDIYKFYLHVLTKRIDYPNSAFDMYCMHILNTNSEEANIRYQTTSNPSFEIGKEVVDQINSILSELFPDYSLCGELARHESIGTPKEGSLKDRKNDFP